MAVVYAGPARPSTANIHHVGRRHDFGTVRKLASGHYQAFYRAGGERYVAPQTYRAKADAKAWLHSQATDRARGTWVADSGGRLTVAQLAGKWLSSNPAKRPATLDRDTGILHAHVLPVLGKQRLSKVTEADLQGLVNGWVAAGLAASTIHRMASCLAAMFAYAVHARYLVTSPATNLKLPQQPTVERPQLTAVELERLAKALGPDQGPMMWLGVVGGLRWAECAGLTAANLDPTEGKIKVEHQLGRDRHLRPPKSAAGKRRIAIPRWLVDDLDGMLARQGLTKADDHALLFRSPKGSPLHYQDWLRRTWVPACRAAGIDRLRFHDLRSMSATVLVASGVDVRTTQARLGHSSPSVTLGIYAKATEQGDRFAAEALGRMVRVSSDGTHRVHEPSEGSLD